MMSNTRFFWVRHLLYFNTCHKVHFGNWSGLKEKESSSSHKHLDNCLLQHEKQLEVSGSWERRGGSGCCGSAVCVKCKKREGTERGEEGSCALRVRGRWTSVAELCTGGRKKRKQSARGKAIVGLLGDHKSNKKITIQWFFQKSAVQRNKSKAAACNKEPWKCQVSPLYFTLLHCGKGIQTCRWAGALSSHIRNLPMLQSYNLLQDNFILFIPKARLNWLTSESVFPFKGQA